VRLKTIFGSWQTSRRGIHYAQPLSSAPASSHGGKDWFCNRYIRIHLVWICFEEILLEFEMT
jgi:hypothetical protein